MEHGKFKADRIADRAIRAIDRKRNEEVSPKHTEGSGPVLAYRGRLFDSGYTVRGEQGRIFVPQKG